MHWNRWFLGLGPLMDSTVFLILPTVLIIGKIYFHHTLGELLSMIYAFSRVYSPIKSLAKVNNELRTLQGATERVFGIMKTIPDIRDRPGAIELPKHRKTIEFKNVDFSYEPGMPILKDISLRIEAGEMLAFVGSTGAGSVGGGCVASDGGTCGVRVGEAAGVEGVGTAQANPPAMSVVSAKSMWKRCFLLIALFW